MKQINWFDRKFDFSFGQQVFPAILERLTGTPVRLEEKLKHIPPSSYRVQPDNKWSILEHIGHLSDLEPLWQGRREDILSGKEVLRPADLLNRKTDEANHNSREPEALISDFRSLRSATVALLEGLPETQLFLSALHPRLRTPMRVIDLFLFVAEHDDHHLAKITEINKSIQTKKE